MEPPIFSFLDWTPATPRLSHRGQTHVDIDANDKTLFRAIEKASPYLARLIAKYPEPAHSALSINPDHWQNIDYQNTLLADDNIMQTLRRKKSETALITALNDLMRRWDVMTATRALSEFAGQAINAALSAAWRRHRSTQGDFPSGLVLLAMGKLGAAELNYSSDVDLIALYDPERIRLDDHADIKRVCVQIVRDTLSILSDQTADGYVFRTDMRLRPDPGASAVAISIRAAENYYETHGQNWERAAFIKASPVAGDIDVGKDFLAHLRPFIWRRYLDFAAIEDIHHIREKIAAAHGERASDHVDLAGHNVKLGIGGIREIEFFVQTHQLIAGGKNPALRLPTTLGTLEAMSQAGIIAPQTAQGLREAYIFFRFVEHRLQMIDDQQTHTVPEDGEALDNVVAFCGFDDLAAFEDVHQRATQITLQAYRDLFRPLQGDRLSDQSAPTQRSSLDFSGTDFDPATADYVGSLGFESVGDVFRIVRTWLRGEYRATRSVHSRVLMEKVLPQVLPAIARASNPYNALLAFDRFIAMLPAGVQIFSLLNHNQPILDRLMVLLTTSPRLAKALSQHQHIVESLISTRPVEFFELSMSTEHLVNQFNQDIRRDNASLDPEIVMGNLNRAVSEAKFTIAAELVQGKITTVEAGTAFSNIAEATLTTLLPAIGHSVTEQFGQIDGDIAVVAFGRLGARRMTFNSDLDLVFVYQSAEDAMSVGVRALDAMTWYARYVRRMVTVLTAEGRDGAIYPVDMQLRPSGGAGPAAVSLKAFSTYYDRDAWLWEMMALVKARVIAGRAALNDQLTLKINSALSRPRPKEDVARAVLEMRARLATERPATSLWDRKLIVGGQTDIEFIAQFLTLTCASEIGLPPNDHDHQWAFFEKAGVLKSEHAQILARAMARNEALLQLSRLGNADIFAPQADGSALTELMITNCGVKTIEQAEATLREEGALIEQVMKEIIGDQ